MVKQCPTRAKYDRLGKPFYIYYLYLYWVWSNLMTLVEKLIMLSRSRSRTLHVYLLLLHWGYAKTCFPSTQKMLYSYIGNIHKNMLYRINAPSSYKCLSWKFSIAEREAWTMKKLFMKRKRKKVLEKMDKCLRYLKQWVLRCPPKKKNKIAPAL